MMTYKTIWNIGGDHQAPDSIDENGEAVVDTVNRFVAENGKEIVSGEHASWVVDGKWPFNCLRAAKDFVESGKYDVDSWSDCGLHYE